MEMTNSKLHWVNDIIWIYKCTPKMMSVRHWTRILYDLYLPAGQYVRTVWPARVLKLAIF